MGNMDISLMSLQASGIRPLVLSVREPSGSHGTDVVIRQRYGFEFMPVSVKSLRVAYRRLRSGGVVLTMVDLPDPSGELLPFCGHASRLPTGHVHMALKTGASIETGASLRHEGGYRIFARGSYLPSRKKGENEAGAVRRVAIRVLADLEADIRRRPDEWLMFHPVWPQVSGSCE
jgi:lauroyl/myristoyl acyltransferase